MKLLPCPFCGGDPKFHTAKNGGEFIECESCNASSTMMFPDKCDAKPLLAERWNAREKYWEKMRDETPTHYIESFSDEVLAFAGAGMLASELAEKLLSEAKDSLHLSRSEANKASGDGAKWQPWPFTVSIRVKKFRTDK